MGLTAREWLLLPKEEQEKRSNELSSEECRKLRMELSMIHFSEEKKARMTEDEKYKFTHPRVYTQEEIEAFSKKTDEIFRRMQEESKRKR